MSHKGVLLIGFFLIETSVYAQKTEDFKITLPESKVAGSLYSSIRVLDIRDDTTDFGIVQKGAFNRKEKLVTATPLAEQFNNLLNALAEKTGTQDELLLLIRQLSFAEVTGMSETGYFQFRAILFANNNGEYKKLERIDTVVVVRSMDVTQKMLRLGSQTITNFISSNLTRKSSSDISLSLDQLPSIDSIEKKRIPLYTTTGYTDGIYYDFHSFANQQPDETGVSVKFDKKDRFQKISYVNKKGQAIDIENRFFYAFVYDGKPYISGEFTCYPLEKRGDDFYFTGKARNVKSGDVATAQLFFGIIGALVASSATGIFEMKIDHLTGGFMRMKEIFKYK